MTKAAGSRTGKRTPIEWLLTSVLILFSLAAMLATYWQLNDPDATRWLLAYFYCAALCMAGAFGYVRIPLAVLGLVVYLPWSIRLYAGLETRGIKVEEWRESMGLFIATLAMIVIIVVASLRRKAEPK